MHLLEKYKDIVDCGGNYVVTNSTTAPSTFAEQVGFFIVATTSYPDLEIGEALHKFQQLCMSYQVNRAKLMDEQHKSLLSQAADFIGSDTMEITPCCGGGKVR